jgi:hypothetical protein
MERTHPGASVKASQAFTPSQGMFLEVLRQAFNNLGPIFSSDPRANTSTLMLRCVRCKTSLPHHVLDTPAWTHCSVCRSTIRMLGFPAAFRKLDVGAGLDSVLAEGQSSCFYHSKKRAVLPCDGCGRFLCSLCDIELSGQHLCPGCLETGRKKGKLKQLQNQRVRYDTIALSLAVLPVLLLVTVGLTVFTAPAAIFVALRYWKIPSSLLPHTRIRFVVAVLLAVCQLAGWAWLAVFLIRQGVS